MIEGKRTSQPFKLFPIFALLIIGSVITMMFAFSDDSNYAFADHNYETRDYPRTTPVTEIVNDSNSSIKVTYLDSHKAEIEIDFSIVRQECHSPDDLILTCTFYGLESQQIEISKKINECEKQGLEFDREYHVCKTSEQIAEEAYDNYQQTLAEEPSAEEIVEDAPKSKTQILLEQLEAKENLTSSDLRLYELLSKLQGVCNQGEGRSAAIQDYDFWDVPIEEYVDSETGDTKIRLADDNSIRHTDHRGLEGKLQKQLDWCLGQQILETTILSEADKHFAEADELGQTYHADLAQYMQPYTQERVEELENKGKIISQQYEAICNNTYWTEKTKAAFDFCPGIEYEEDSEVVSKEMKDYMLTEPMLKKLQCEEDPETCEKQLKEENLRKYKERTK